MTLTNKDRNWLRGVGFIPREIRHFANAKDPAGKLQPPIDLSSPAWQAMMTSRKDWIVRLVALGFTPDMIDRQIEGFWVHQATFDPFKFLKEVYKEERSGHAAMMAIGYQVARERRRVVKEYEDRGEEPPPTLSEVKDTRNYPSRPEYKGW